MKLRVFASGTMSRRCMAGLETEDGEIAVAHAQSPRAVCKKAAERLRKMADRFDRLASTPKPLNADEQDRINRAT